MIQQELLISFRTIAGQETEFTTRTFMSGGDRINFERRFRINTQELKAILDDKGPAALNEEWLAFFAWRCANREIGDQGSFDEFVDRLDHLVCKAKVPKDGDGAASGDGLPPPPDPVPAGSTAIPSSG